MLQALSRPDSNITVMELIEWFSMIFIALSRSRVCAERTHAVFNFVEAVL